MAINIGRNKIKKLRLGNNIISTVHKGSDIIYADLESLYGVKLTIDTTLDEYGNHTSTRKKFRIGICADGYWRDNDSYFTIYWGDGSSDTIYGRRNHAVVHTYAEHGIYHILIMPHQSLFNGIYPKKGWMSHIVFGNGRQGFSNDDACKVVSFDNALPESSIVLFGQRGGDIQDSKENLEGFFRGMMNLSSVPEDFFDYITIVHNQTQSYENLFYQTLDSTGNITGNDIISLIKRLSSRIDYSNATNYKNAFSVYRNSNFLFLTPPTFKVDFNGLLDGISTENLTDFSYMFSGWGVGAAGMEPLSESFFSDINTSNGTNFSHMFYRFLPEMNSKSPIPNGFLSFLDTSNGTDLSYMFSEAFRWSGPGGTTKGGVVPADLFSSIDASSAITMEGMFAGCFKKSYYREFPSGMFSNFGGGNCSNFSRVFYAMFDSSWITKFPSKMFMGIDTSGGTNFSYALSSTFGNLSTSIAAQYRNFPEDIFDGLDTSSGTDMSSMFELCFTYTPQDLPDNMFTYLDFTNATNCSRMFSNLFYLSTCIPSGSVLGDNFFAGLYLPSAKNVSYMFDRMTRMANFSKTSTKLFSGLNIPAAENFEGMFQNTFEHQGEQHRRTLFDGDVQSDFFGNINMSHATNTKKMFYYTFVHASNYTRDENKIVFPSDLFDFVDLTNVTDATEMFKGTFSSVNCDYPTGILNKVVPSQNTTVTGIFGSTFSASYKATSGVINDVFDGITDLSWINQNNAADIMPSMFSQSLSNDASTVDANTILQHFNFTPVSDTDMFSGRTNLTDYATINDNWK